MAATRLIPMYINKGKTLARCLKELFFKGIGDMPQQAFWSPCAANALLAG